MNRPTRLEAPPAPPLVVPGVEAGVTARPSTADRLALGGAIIVGGWLFWVILGGVCWIVLGLPALDWHLAGGYVLGGLLPPLFVVLRWYLLPYTDEVARLPVLRALWTADLDDRAEAHAVQRAVLAAWSDKWNAPQPPEPKPPPTRVIREVPSRSDADEARARVDPDSGREHITRQLPAALVPWESSPEAAIVEALLGGRKVSSRDLPAGLSRRAYDPALATLRAAGIVQGGPGRAIALAPAWDALRPTPYNARARIARRLGYRPPPPPPPA